MTIVINDRPTQKTPDSASRSIPTTYKGVHMRSRLEARWAAFFDNLGWGWHYEPVDLEFYIPDFVLDFNAGAMAVEVKPEVDLTLLKQYTQRIIWAGWDKELIAVGARLFSGDGLGLIGERWDGQTVIDKAIVFRCLSCGEVSIRSDAGWWKCRRCGADDGNAHVGELDPGELEGHWKEAGNRVQWRAK